MLSFTVESVINCVHNERIVWDPAVNGSEEQKELAWHRIAECFGFATGKLRIGHVCPSYGMY